MLRMLKVCFDKTSAVQYVATGLTPSHGHPRGPLIHIIRIIIFTEYNSKVNYLYSSTCTVIAPCVRRISES